MVIYIFSQCVKSWKFAWQQVILMLVKCFWYQTRKREVPWKRGRQFLHLLRAQANDDPALSYVPTCSNSVFISESGLVICEFHGWNYLSPYRRRAHEYMICPVIIGLSWISSCLKPQIVIFVLSFENMITGKMDVPRDDTKRPREVATTQAEPLGRISHTEYVAWPYM
jgi:hypothetical protein